MTPLHKGPVTEGSNLARPFKLILPMLFSLLEKGLGLGLGSLSVVALLRSFVHTKLIKKSVFLAPRRT